MNRKKIASVLLAVTMSVGVVVPTMTSTMTAYAVESESNVKEAIANWFGKEPSEVTQEDYDNARTLEIYGHPSKDIYKCKKLVKLHIYDAEGLKMDFSSFKDLKVLYLHLSEADHGNGGFDINAPGVDVTISSGGLTEYPSGIKSDYVAVSYFSGKLSKLDGKPNCENPFYAPVEPGIISRWQTEKENIFYIDSTKLDPDFGHITEDGKPLPMVGKYYVAKNNTNSLWGSGKHKDTYFIAPSENYIYLSSKPTGNEVKPEVKPEEKPVKPEEKPVTPNKPEVKPSNPSDGSNGDAGQSGDKDSGVDSGESVKPEIKPEVKPEVKPEKPAVKPEEKPEVTPEKPEAKPEVDNKEEGTEVDNKEEGTEVTPNDNGTEEDDKEVKPEEGTEVTPNDKGTEVTPEKPEVTPNDNGTEVTPNDKEATTEKPEVTPNNKETKLPATGMTAVASVIGATIAGTGAFFLKRKRK